MLGMTINRLNNVLEHFRKRRFIVVKALRVGEAYMLSKGSLYVDLWAPTKDYIKYHDYERLAKMLELDKVQALVVFSYRPHSILDYLKRLMDSAERWYGITNKVRIIGVSEVDPDRGIEEAIEKLHTYFAELVSGPTTMEGKCPRCVTGDLQRYQFDDYFSYKLNCISRQYVYVCNMCGLRISRQESLKCFGELAVGL